jgi:hypothetical protein
VNRGKSFGRMVAHFSPRRSGCVLLKYKSGHSVLKASALHRLATSKDLVFDSNIDRAGQVRHLLQAKTHTPKLSFVVDALGAFPVIVWLPVLLNA